MVSIIKNQLLKHLSRFTKNLSADKINLSTFKGEGELSNLELNESVLTDLLELPSWLKLTKAWCNKVCFRIPWTKLKNVPILLILDEVNVTVETCEELRSMSPQAGLSSYAAIPGKYSYIHKIIDGITVATLPTHYRKKLYCQLCVKALTIQKDLQMEMVKDSLLYLKDLDRGALKVPSDMITEILVVAFKTFQINKILVQSKNRQWKEADLRMTRLKDPEKGHLLIFKELSWQTVRIEAKSTKDKNLTPLRLLTNQARCRIIIKKRLSDSFIMGSKLVVILDDLLWVLTDSQLKAALHFLDSLAGLVQKATSVTRKAKAARKLEELPEYRAQLDQQARQKDNKASHLSKIFAIYDVVETSYHFVSHQIILHLIDDSGAGRSSHPNLKDGGALQIALKRFQVDYYPYHLAKGDRKPWPCYRDGVTPHTQWYEQALNAFKSKLSELVEKNKTQHVPLSRSNKPAPHTAATTEDVKRGQPNPTLKNFVINQFAKLMTTCVVLRMEDFTLYKVTTLGKKQSLREFITGDRDHMSLPEEASIIHAEFIYFYYPDDIPFPLPPPKFYVQVNPIQILFDVDSCLWFNAFALNLYQSLADSKQDISASDYTYIDVKIEAILPRITFESSQEFHNQKDRPKSLNFQVTRVTITNVRSLEQSSRADLAKCVDSFHMGSLFFGTEFPSQTNDIYIVTQKFLDHISTKDNIRNLPADLNATSVEAMLETLSREMLWTEAKDVWCVNLDPVWGEFFGARAVGVNKSVPFLDAVPITVWMHTQLDPNSTVKSNSKNSPNNADIHVLAHVSNLVSVQLNHYQYLFLLRLAEEAAELTTFLSLDSSRITKVESTGSLALGAIIPQVETTFVMPSQCPGKESSGGDVESFVPDSSSIADDAAFGGSTATVWQNSTLSITHPDNNTQKVTFVSQTEEVISHSPPPQEVEVNRATTKHVQQPFSNMNLSNNLNAGFSSMKKGFSTLVTSLDSALKASPDDMSDTISIRSDASSDSEKYVMVAADDRNVESIDDMFFVLEFCYEYKGTVEIASEVLEDESSITTTSEQSLVSSCRRKDLVSVSTFKLTKVEFLQQSVGCSSSIKVQVGNISSDDCSSIPWDEFQSKFSSRSRAWTDIPSTDSATTPRVKLRLDHSLILPSSKSLMEIDFSDKAQLKKLFKDLLTIHVNNLNLELTMSTVTGLADLAEDEIIAAPIPMEITLDNVQLRLNEDRPPVNITSPGPVPIHLDVVHLFIARGDDGVFRIIPSKSSSMSTSSSTISEIDTAAVQANKQLKIENEELRRRLAAFERVTEENHELRRSKEETDVLRSCLSSAQDEVTRLLDEKLKLLEMVKRLQDQSPDKNRQWNSKR